MDNYKLHLGSSNPEDGEQAYATGNRETVLLVTEHPYKEPVIVRSADIQTI